MQSMFRQYARALLSPAIDTYNGESLTLRPQLTRPNFSPEPDAKRPVVKGVAGVFSSPATEALGSGERHDRRNHETRGMDGMVRVSSRRPTFSIAVDNLPYALKRGDQIWRDNGDGFEVKEALPDGVHRVVFHVVQLGLQSQLGD